MQAQSQKPPKSVRQGLQHFNNRSFYQAHEDFEAAWRETSGFEREFYRALLQISGGYFRLTQGNGPGAQKFFNLALGWLSQFPPSFQGVNNLTIQKNIKAVLNDLGRGRHPSATLEQHFQPININDREFK